MMGPREKMRSVAAMWLILMLALVDAEGKYGGTSFYGHLTTKVTSPI